MHTRKCFPSWACCCCPFQNNMKVNNFDVIVIGAGSAGLSVGLTMNKFGFNVLMIAKSGKEIGGECLNNGCIPSKALIHAAGIVHHARMATQFGWEGKGGTDLRKVMEYVKSAQSTIRTHENAEALRQAGITVEPGSATFVDKRSVEVNGKIFRGRKIVIATGSRPQKLQVPGIEMVTIFDNENIFNLERLPKSLLVVGGGPVGVEMAQAMCRLGSRVTLVHGGQAILEHDDPVLTGILKQRLEEEGISILLNSKVISFTSANDATVITKKGETLSIRAESFFIATGRASNIEQLELQNAGIRVREGRIETNDYLQTSNKHIFVCGDVAGGLQFSHVAEYHARILINNFFSPFRKKCRVDDLSWVTFTDPEIATFGLSEDQLRQRHIRDERLEQDFGEDHRAVTDNYRYGKLILLLKKGGMPGAKRILGGSMIAPGAGELIQELLLLQTQRSSLNPLFGKIYPYPVASRINQQLAVRYKERQLTSTVKVLLKWVFHVFNYLLK